MNRNQSEFRVDEAQHDPSCSAIGTTIYRPAPVVVPKRQKHDFEDLPDQEPIAPAR